MTDQLTTARAPERGLRRVLVADQVLVSLGIFSVLPVLGHVLSLSGSGVLVGVGLFLYTASAGLSALAVNRWIPRLPYRGGMAGSAVLSAVAFGALPHVSDTPWAVCALLVLAGLGVSAHFVLSRVLIAETVPDDIGRTRLYSALQVAVNAAAAAGPFAATFLLDRDPRLLLGVVAACHLVAAAVLCLGVPAGQHPPPTSDGWPVSRRALRTALRSPATRRVLVVCTFGAFVYAQFFSAFALLVADSVDAPALRAALLAGPALLIVLCQTAVTRAVTTAMASGTRPFAVLGAGTLLFAAAMLLLGVGLPLLTAVIAAVVVFSVAEMAFTPMVSTAFAGLPIPSTLEAFNLRQVCWTTGEALGSLAGGSLFLLLHRSGHAAAYWHLLAWPTAAVVLALLIADRRSAV